MSIVTLKNKTMTQYGKNNSSNNPWAGNYWINQGPFGNTQKNVLGYSDVGFSLNGGHRNIGYIGKTYNMSKNGTPYKGNYAMGSGGSGGGYNTTNQVFNSSRFYLMGRENKYIKPSTLSTKGMLYNKYKWIHSGQYPNYWVQPNYGTSMLADTKSQGNYIDNLAVSNLCVSDVNNIDKYEGYIKKGGSTLCKTTTAGLTYDDIARNGLYTKFVNQSQDCSTYTREVKQSCIDIYEYQKPYPFGTNGDACMILYYPPEPV